MQKKTVFSLLRHKEKNQEKGGGNVKLWEFLARVRKKMYFCRLNN